MIFSKLNSKNVKFTLKDMDDNEEESLEIIFNNGLFKEFVESLVLLKVHEIAIKEPLTIREKEVLKYLITGKTNDEIAKILNVTIHTSKAHIHNIFRKLSVQDRTQAAIKAIKYNIIEF